MSTPQSTTPYSLRVSTRLAQLIESVAKKTGKRAPDAVRAGIEAAFSNEYRMLALDAANTDRASTLRTLRGAVAEANTSIRLPLPVYSALMYFLHWSYLHAGFSGFANPRYVTAMLDITADLLALGEKMYFTDGHSHARYCLGLKEGENLFEGISRIKLDLQNGLSVGYAEFLTRPLETMADDLQYLDPAVVARIFSPHLRTLLPVAVAGAMGGIDTDIVLRDMEEFLPDTESFDINTLNWELNGKSVALVVSEGHQMNAFGPHAVLSLCTAIECDALEYLLAPGESLRSFSRGDFELTRSGEQVLMHTKGGYRLVLSVVEARQLIDRLAIAFSKPAWRGLVTRYRELCGDI